VGASQDASGLSYFSVVDAPAVTTMHNSTSQQPRYFVIPGVASAETITLTLWYRHSLMEPYIVAAHETVDTDISWCVISPSPRRRGLCGFSLSMCFYAAPRMSNNSPRPTQPSP
jgi:hypothetical protein